MARNRKSSRANNFRTTNARSFGNNKKFASKKKWDPKATETKSSDSYFGAPINDIKWYRDNEQLLNDVARVAYNIPVGLPFRNDGMLRLGNDSWSVPGIVVMNVVPTFGICKSPVDPTNIAFSGMFTFIRSHTSSKFDWDDNTLGINMLATDSLYYMTKWMTRLYATLPLFHQSNKYLPKALIEAQGVDYEDLLTNAANFRAELNMRIARINALKIPSELYVFERHMWLFENYYIEGPSTKDQIYMYKPAAYYVHTKDANGISMLECHRTLTGGTGTDGRLTASDLIRKLDAMLNPIFNDQYFNLISGYIEQAYEGKVMSLNYLPDQMVTPLIYSEEVLLQFKNAKPIPVRHDPNSAMYYGGWFNLTQQPASSIDIRICLKTITVASGLKLYRSINDGIATDITGSSTTAEHWNMFAVANELCKQHMITSPHADVVPAENMINTRLIPSIHAHIDEDAGGMPAFQWDSYTCGTEWPINFEIYTRWHDGANNSFELHNFELHNVMYADVTDNTIAYVLGRLLPIISVFKYLPELRIVTRVGATDNAVEQCFIPFFEVDNYALLTDNELDMMHKSALMSMLRIPEIASTSLSAR